MKILDCPLNGPRNITEFQYLGPLRQEEAEDAESLVARVFFPPNPAGVLVEWWRHTTSNTVFLAERNTLTDEVVRTWLPDRKSPEEFPA